MRVSSPGSGGSDERMFTVIAQGVRANSQRRSERSYNVPYSRLEATFRLITANGGRVIAVTPSTVAGVQDTRFQALMPDVLHWLGITKIHNFISMSDMKSRPASLRRRATYSPVGARAGTTPSSSPASRS